MAEIKDKEAEQRRLNMLLALSDPARIDEIVKDFTPEAAQTVREDLQALYEDTKAEVLESFTAKDSGRNYINTSPVTRELLKHGKHTEIMLGNNPDTGETAIFSLLDGYITPYEKEIIECITKFRKDGQITENGNIMFTLSQLFRAMRHGAGTTRVTAEQKKALAADMEALRRDVVFKLNDYLKVWGGFKTNGGAFPLISFAKLFGKLNGQEEILYIVSNDMNIVNDISERLHMGQTVSQEVKAIKKDGKPWKLSSGRIVLRQTLQDFVFSYIRARRVGRNYSPQLPYKRIFEACEIAQTYENRKKIARCKEDIATILNYWKELEIIASWQEYTNADSKKPDGVEIRICKDVLQAIEGTAE